jgi:hypothetical protein
MDIPLKTSLNGDQLIELYKAYLAAFNCHSMSGIKDHLSPGCTSWSKGKQITRNREEMLPHYTEHWEKFQSPIEIEEIRPIDGGVWVMLKNHDGNQFVEVNYYYDENGLQIKHDIKGVTPMNVEKRLEQPKEAEDGV